ncbi:O-antigen polysaccharide polymerase Wzy [Sinomonas humi]|uniref:O-antigen polysaccharide polymerase Wzy n=1 Tax=Sinomonas humi TaxID=1338436 RepID=UPI0018CCB545|nr:O-antigen polysaccharide polymerase Wzy [Sinomonas humi]
MTNITKIQPTKRTTAQTGLVMLLGAPMLLVLGTALGLSNEPTLKGIGIAIVGLAAGLMILQLGRGPIDPLGPAAFITYSHILLFILRPAYGFFYQDNINLFTQTPFDSSTLWAQVIAATGYISLSIGIRLGSRKYLGSERAQPLLFEPTRDRAIILPLWLTVGLGFALYVVYIRQTGWGNYLTILKTGRTLESSQALESSSAYFYAGLSVATGALLLIFMLDLYRNNRLGATLALMLVLLCLVPSFASGSRSVFIPTLAALVIVFRSRFPRAFSFRRLLIWSPAVFIVLFIAPRVWRVGLAQGGSLSQSLADAFLPQNYLDGFLGGYDTAMLDSFSLQVQAQNSGMIGHQYGSTYLSLLVAIVPRTLWPSKPVTVDQVLNAYLFPATNSQGIGFSFGFYSEPFLNFGPLGVAVVCIIFGFALERLFTKATSSSDIVLRYSAIMASTYMFTLMRGSISFDSQRLLIAIIPALIAVWMGRRMFSTASRSHPIKIGGTR